MTSKWFGGALAGWLAGLGLAAWAAPAGALELELPGERKFEVHGFYEMRIKTYGEDAPFRGLTFSQFRHVLSLEQELGLFPEGVGPFDVMNLVTRWTISYECIYQKACGTWNSADSYGYAERDPVREPKHFKKAYTRTPYAGGVLAMNVFPGSNISTHQRITPGHRYRSCFNPDGVFANPFPLSAFCNLNSRTQLDNPGDQFLLLSVRTRGGVVNPQGTSQLLRASRPFLEERPATDPTFDNLFDELSALPLLDTPGVPQQLRNGLVRALQAEQQRKPDFDPTPEQEALLAQFNGVDANGDGDFTDAGDTLPSLNSRFATLLSTRPDPERFQPLDRANGAGIFNSLWGASAFTDNNLAWLTDMDFHVRPDGYFTTQNADVISESAIGMADNLAGGIRTDDILGPIEQQNTPDRIPWFIGPDGLRNTADDLPISPCAPGFARGADLRCSPDADGDGVGDAPTNPTDPSAEPVYYVRTDFTPPADATLEQRRSQCWQLLTTRDAGGLNMNGECIIFSTFGRPGLSAGATLAAADLALDPRLRPSTARLDPTNVTDLKVRSAGGFIPARPANPAGGLFYTTAGLRHFQQSNHHYVSNLDVDFTEDELRWEHGAGQREHEFSEGYVEFEMLDSQVWTRVGKLLVVWGKTELFRNQDRLNPVDIGLGTLSRLEEARLGQWMVQTVISPEMFMRVGPFEDLRLELVGILNDFTPTDLGECGESNTFELVCGKTFGAIANGMVGIGLVGESRPDEIYSGAKRFDFGARIEGRFDRFTFSVSDFWGWDDGLILDVVHQYGRRVDPETGAPVNVTGPAECRVRTVDGQAAGPDGNPATAFDNAIPSVGNCLLFDNPVGTDAQQLRASDEIALHHYANQTLFNTICSLTFDEDTGTCALDGLNDYDLWSFVSRALAGDPLVQGLAIEGYQFVREQPTTDPLDRTRLTEVGDSVFSEIFTRLPVVGEDGDVATLSEALNNEQKALLGCGDAYLSPCDVADQTRMSSPEYRATITDAPDFRTVGGVDLMNADASVITQEFTILKAFSSGALVGARGIEDNAGYFEAGVSTGEITPELSAQFGIPVTPGIDPSQAMVLGDGATLAVRDSIVDLFGVESFDDLTRAQQTLAATDFQIEPSKWIVDEELLARGVFVFRDPRGPDGALGAPEGADGTLGTADDLWDPRGEDCTNVYGRPDPGCTALEVISANIERLTIAAEIVGNDRAFDPPETFREILAILDNDASTDAFGDPVAGVDGIRFNDFDRNEDGFVADGVDDQGDQKAILHRLTSGSQAVADNYQACLVTRALGSPVCYLNLDRTSVTADPGYAQGPEGQPIVSTTEDRIIGALPIGVTLSFFDGATDTPGTFRGTAVFPLQRLSAVELQQFALADRLVNVPASRFTEQELAILNTQLTTNSQLGPITMDDTITLRPDGRLNTLPRTCPGGVAPCFVLAGDAFNRLMFTRTVDGNQTPDLDEDNDNSFDFVDDGTAGPITDDNILCGSGLPGDNLQTAAQHELSRSEAAELAAAGGLPPRSPIFCRGLTGLLNVTGRTLPITRAGGDGRFGRRDFLWHGGKQVAVDYQKFNVMGFSLDFAEDVTKTSWGIEFSASSNKLIANSNEYSGYSTANDMTLSISVDRPTFFNFLNPNRSFFINFQFFINYLDDYRGGDDDLDGNFAATDGPVTGLITLTAFTGYFQDRLNPRFTLVYHPTSSSAGVISGLNYRFTESFSTGFGFNHFFGHGVQSQGARFPIALFTHPDTTAEKVTGLTPVRNRDEISWTVRYSF